MEVSVKYRSNTIGIYKGPELVDISCLQPVQGTAICFWAGKGREQVPMLVADKFWESLQWMIIYTDADDLHRLIRYGEECELVADMSFSKELRRTFNLLNLRCSWVKYFETVKEEEKEQLLVRLRQEPDTALRLLWSLCSSMGLNGEVDYWPTLKLLASACNIEQLVNKYATVSNVRGKIWHVINDGGRKNLEYFISKLLGELGIDKKQLLERITVNVLTTN